MALTLYLSINLEDAPGTISSLRSQQCDMKLLLSSKVDILSGPLLYIGLEEIQTLQSSESQVGYKINYLQARKR
jgi:hypothetical protein